jgi:flavin reductase (DIM6/NTAB) family NADH-FMN oxidoreductase RutF
MDLPTFDTRQFRHALGRFASGVTVVTAMDGGKPHGMTANAFVSVSLDPPLVLVSVDKRATMHRILSGGRKYGVSVLAQDQEKFSNHFAGRIIEGLHTPFFDHNGVPLLEGSVAYFVAEIVDAHTAGDHTLFIARVEHFQWNEDRPLLFWGGKYQHLHRELKAAPSWQDEFSLFSIGGVDPPIG